MESSAVTSKRELRSWMVFSAPWWWHRTPFGAPVDPDV